MTFRRGWFTPDHEGFDAAQDELACPDIHGLEPAGRPLTFNRRARSLARPASAAHVGTYAADLSAPGLVQPSSPHSLGAEPSSTISAAPTDPRDGA